MNAAPSTTASLRFQNYTLHWLALLAMCVTFAAGLWLRWEQPFVQTKLPSGDPGQRSFFVIQLPHAGGLPEDQYQAKLNEWLTALSSEQFQPMPLSEIVFRSRKQMTLPRGAVALVYDEALRETLVKARPVIESRRVPTVVLTHRGPIEEADFGFISRHEAALMTKSQIWDFGYYVPSNPGLAHFDRKDRPPVIAGRQGITSLWTADPNGRILNRGTNGKFFTRLFLPLTWTGTDLLNRLLAEAPAPPEAILSVRTIAGVAWGVARRGEDAAADRFTLKASPRLRTGSILWLGTEGIRDFKLGLDVRRHVGEIWLLLRSDRLARESLRLGFTDGAIQLMQETRGRQRLLAQAPWVQSVGGQALNAAVRLNGRHLEVTGSQNEMLLQFDGLPEEMPETPLIQMFVYDPVHGSALAEDAQITLSHSGETR